MVYDCTCIIFLFILSCDRFVSHVVLSLDLTVMLPSHSECFLCHSIAISSKTNVCVESVIRFFLDSRVCS